MIARVRPSRRRKSAPAWHSAFLAMLPAIRQQARFAFRHLDPEARQDAMQEVIANCLVAYVRLVDQNRSDIAYPTALAHYAIAQVKSGRKVGSQLRIGDVLSRYAQRSKGFTVKRLDRFSETEGQWIEAVIPDDRRPVPDQAAFRLDFPAWLATQSDRDRSVALALAGGDSTSNVAEKFDVSLGRVSQLRRELYQSWNEFHGDDDMPRR